MRSNLQRSRKRHVVVALVTGWIVWIATAGTAEAADEQLLFKTGAHATELARALREMPAPRQEGFRFLLENMPEADLQELAPSLLIENTTLAYDAFEKAPWRDAVPKEIFLNDVLPYVCVNERRDAWRKILREKCAPLIEDCKTPGEAAQRLNQKLFQLVNVRYSTARQKADQSPLETMESGLATCTGLSILLIDACRSVGIPARLVGTPMWTNLRGNHTWVEVWDNGWHFTGAAEPDPKGLDRGWFTHDASQARGDIPQHAIYASSFRKTGLAFPLVWAPGVSWVSAVNVTDRYTPRAERSNANAVRLLVKVLDRPAGTRVPARVMLEETTNSLATVEGLSRGESADLNDILPFDVVPGRSYELRAEQGDQKVRREFRASTNAQEVVVLCLNDTPALAVSSQACYAPPAVIQKLKAADEAKLKKAVTEFFVAATNKEARFKFASRLEKLLRDNEPAVRRAVWEAYQAAPLHAASKKDFEAREVRFEQHVSPYTVKTVGSRPANGWALFIAMHGGGNAPKRVNDSQWQVMQRYYHEHPEAGGYLYVALRAPNDRWNGFYDVYVYPLVANLIREFLLFGDVDPNKVFIMGYSHGGYGAFAIGPKMPDRFAAIHASAAAPTDGETVGDTLRNTVFTCMIGEKDTMYGRFERDQKFKDAVEKLRGERTDIYPVTVQIIAGNGHIGLPDRDKIKDMYPAVRHPVPSELTWLMTDKVITEFFWLETDSPDKQQRIDARCRDNRITVTTSSNVNSAAVLLDARLIDFKKPVTVEWNGKSSRQKLQPSLRVLCETLLRRGDPELAFSARMELPVGR